MLNCHILVTHAWILQRCGTYEWSMYGSNLSKRLVDTTENTWENDKLWTCQQYFEPIHDSMQLLSAARKSYPAANADSTPWYMTFSRDDEWMAHLEAVCVCLHHDLKAWIYSHHEIVSNTMPAHWVCKHVENLIMHPRQFSEYINKCEWWQSEFVTEGLPYIYIYGRYATHECGTHQIRLDWSLKHYISVSAMCGFCFTCLGSTNLSAAAQTPWSSQMTQAVSCVSRMVGKQFSINTWTTRWYQQWVMDGD